jgi:C-terminal processing protease CtpA/Prc
VCNYSIPLKITKVEGLDSILVGKALVATPKRTVATDWTILPKDYTLFGIKYINKYHGYYLRRGADKLTNTLTSVVAGTKTYRSTYVEGSEVVKVQTVSLDTIAVPSIIRRYNLPDGGALNLKVVFASDNTCKVINTATKLEIGSGMLKENGDMWGGKPRDVIYLDYAYTDIPRNEKHEVKDTMVIRDRGVGFELFIPTLKP